MKYCLTKLNILLPLCKITSIHWVLFQNNVCEVITHMYQTGRRISKYRYNRPFQGSYRHIAGGAKTLGRARGHQWRPYYLLVSERKLPFEILPFFSKNVYISISNSYFLDNR